MTLRELNKRERILAIAIAVVILLVSYGLIRYQPPGLKIVWPAATRNNYA